MGGSHWGDSVLQSVLTLRTDCSRFGWKLGWKLVLRLWGFTGSCFQSRGSGREHWNHVRFRVVPPPREITNIQKVKGFLASSFECFFNFLLAPCLALCCFCLLLIFALLQVVVHLMLLVVVHFVLLFAFHLCCCCLLRTLHSCCSFWVVATCLVLLVLALSYYCSSCIVAPCLTLLLFVHVFISPSFVLLLLVPHLVLLLFVLLLLLLVWVSIPPLLPCAGWSLECEVRKREKR